MRSPETFIPYIERTWMEDHPPSTAVSTSAIRTVPSGCSSSMPIHPPACMKQGSSSGLAPGLRQVPGPVQQRTRKAHRLLEVSQSLSLPRKTPFLLCQGSLEDLTNTEYLRDCAIQGGPRDRADLIDDIGWDQDTGPLWTCRSSP